MNKNKPSVCGVGPRQSGGYLVSYNNVEGGRTTKEYKNIEDATEFMISVRKIELDRILLKYKDYPDKKISEVWDKFCTGFNKLF